MKPSPSQDNCFHLTVDMVLEIHGEALARFGGSAGIRELALLESAVAAPQATFGGQSPYADLIEIAGAYLFYLCTNHPFIDGNKRAALGACLVFLRVNGLKPHGDSQAWTELTLAVAAHAMDRADTTEKLRLLVESAQS